MKIEYVYKYRSGNTEIRDGKISEFERNLRSLEKNSFYASDIKSLNDPCEGEFDVENLKKNVKCYSFIFGASTDKTEVFNNQIDKFKQIIQNTSGIYSLAGRFNHELLWAYYANSHNGFCIEYDLNVLKNGYSSDYLNSFKVDYSSKPPLLKITDIQKKEKLISIKKLVGFKSKLWKHEEETRILFNNSGIKNYLPNAVKGIYFGLRMPLELREEIMKRLAGRNIAFYEIVRKTNTYIFERKEVINKHNYDFEYFKEIPNSITKNGKVQFIITKINYINKKGIIETEFEKPVSKESLLWLAKLIKSDLFNDADRVFMMHHLKNKKNAGIGWASSNYILGKYEININY